MTQLLFYDDDTMNSTLSGARKNLASSYVSLHVGRHFEGNVHNGIVFVGRSAQNVVKWNRGPLYMEGDGKICSNNQSIINALNNIQFNRRLKEIIWKKLYKLGFEQKYYFRRVGKRLC